ncbi:MAG: glycosyltransferase family 39 protein, partial [Chloroflexia bacterium]
IGVQVQAYTRVRPYKINATLLASNPRLPPSYQTLPQLESTDREYLNIQVCYTLRAMQSRYVLPAIFLLGLALRLATLDAHGYWGDEVNSLDGASIGFPDMIWGRFGYVANQTPLHYIIVWLTSTLADPAATSILVRLPSALAGALTILAVYALGKETFGYGQGLVAALLVALSPRLLSFSQDLRLYSLMVLLTVLSVYCLLRADRTDSPRWWTAFALAHIANVANAYVALTLATPPLMLYLGWVLWKKWQARAVSQRTLVYAVIGIGVALAGTALAALDLLGAPRMSPNLGLFSPMSALASVIEFLTWFTNFGFSGNVERLLQMLVLLIALLGLFAALAHPMRDMRRYEPAYICTLYIVVPPVMLAVLATTSVVFQRYALFAMPFYFLLVGHGIVTLYSLGAAGEGRYARFAQQARVTAVALAVVIVGAFGAGAYFYENPATHVNMAYRPDFRAAARHLSNTATPVDTIIFLDDPGLGYTITNFYWHNEPPTAAYDARDPRLFARQPPGDIYWVVSLEDLGALDRISSGDQGWGDVARFERVSVLRQSGQADMKGAMDGIVSKLETIWLGAQPVITLRGCIQQANNDLQQAADTYRRAGTYFPVGDDYLRTAEGYDKLGLDTFAWREAFISKFWQPFRPQVHEWLAEKLAQDGYGEQSRAEAELARLLSADPAP